MDVLGGWCRDLEVELKELVGSKSKVVLHNMQKTVISGTLNISRTFKIATWTMNIALNLLSNFLPSIVSGSIIKEIIDSRFHYSQQATLTRPVVLF